MSTNRPIVVGWDGSDCARDALRWAATAAQRLARPLEVVYASHVAEPVFASYELAVVTVPVPEEFVEGTLQAARDLVAEVAPDVPVTARAVEGHPVSVLLDQAQHADLVVIGSRGHSRLTSMLIGATSVAVASHAPCPVVVVRDKGSEAADAPVVVGTDGSDSSAEAIRFAARAADAMGVPLEVLGAVPGYTEAAALSSPVPVEILQEAREEATVFVHEALGGLREDYPDLKITVTISERPAQAALAEAAGHARLLVVGSRGRGGFMGMLLGSVSRSVLFSAHCPVAVVRPQGQGPKGH